MLIAECRTSFHQFNYISVEKPEARPADCKVLDLWLVQGAEADAIKSKVTFEMFGRTYEVPRSLLPLGYGGDAFK